MAQLARAPSGAVKPDVSRVVSTFFLGARSHPYLNEYVSPVVNWNEFFLKLGDSTFKLGFVGEKTSILPLDISNTGIQSILGSGRGCELVGLCLDLGVQGTQFSSRRCKLLPQVSIWNLARLGIRTRNSDGGLIRGAVVSRG